MDDNLEVIMITDRREATRDLLEKMMVENGHINLALLQKRDIDYAVFLLRDYRAISEI